MSATSAYLTLKNPGEPVPLAVKPSMETEFIKEYAAAAAAIGYQSKRMLVEQFRALCHERGIPQYERLHVKRYLDLLYGGPTRMVRVPMTSWALSIQAGAEPHTIIREERVPTWGWRPLASPPFDWLREWGPQVFGSHTAASDSLIGFDADRGLYRLYDKPIPLPVLLRAQEIKEAFPGAVFFASDECTEHDIAPIHDPFMAVVIAGEFFIFEKWDEPSFRG